jgi:hypothetical protein
LAAAQEAIERTGLESLPIGADFEALPIFVRRKEIRGAGRRDGDCHRSDRPLKYK